MALSCHSCCIAALLVRRCGTNFGGVITLTLVTFDGTAMVVLVDLDGSPASRGDATAVVAISTLVHLAQGCEITSSIW